MFFYFHPIIQYQDSFDVDAFVADCRRRVQLETLREDLHIYFKSLKNAMVELINKDYADFVNLSSNLVRIITIPLKTIFYNYNKHKQSQI